MTLGQFSVQGVAHDRHAELGSFDQLREYTFSASPVAQVVVTAEDVVALINQQAEVVFGLSSRDVGRPLRDLEISYRPVELRAYVEQAGLERRAIRVKDIEWQRGTGEVVWLEIHVNPMVDGDSGLLGVSIVFHDVTAARALLDELAHANRQLESAYEELQSTVEELQAINDTLRERSLELDEANDFLESILTSVRSGLAVVDTEMRVLAWNRGAEDLWGLRADEAAGQHLLNLDIGLPMAQLQPAVRRAPCAVRRRM